MAATKKSRSGGDKSLTRRLLGWLLAGSGRPVALLLLLAAGFGAAWFGIWRRMGSDILHGDDYLIGPQQVELTPPPPWIHTDIRGEAFRDARLELPLSLMDDDLAKQLAAAFAQHPWIAKVHQVSKHFPARVRVDVTYRRPVCMVEVPGGLYPVDIHGVLLPRRDFSPVEASRYPRLVGIGGYPRAVPGQGWGDPRVVGGAEIAAALADAWDDLKLAAITTGDAKSNAAQPGDLVYSLVTRGGSTIYWGPPPGVGGVAELPAADKVARLQAYVRKYGALDGHHAPQHIDIRSIRVSARTDSVSADR